MREMKCVKCDQEAEWDFGEGERYCQDHFEEMCDESWWRLVAPLAGWLIQDGGQG